MAESIQGEELGAAEMAAIEAQATQHPYRLRSGAIVHWRRFGKGEPLVLVHGGHGNWGHWIRNIEALASIQRRSALRPLPEPCPRRTKS